MSIICFENVDVYGGISWANQTFNKFERDGRPKCVDTEILSDYLTPTAAWTGKCLPCGTPHIILTVERVQCCNSHFCKNLIFCICNWLND